MKRKKSIFTFDVSAVVPHMLFIIFAAVLTVGILVGSLSFGRISVISDFCDNRILEIISIRQPENFAVHLQQSSLLLTSSYIVLFLFGASVFGCVSTPIIIFTFGLYYGIISGGMYVNFKLDGIMYCALLIIPYMLIAAFGMLLLAEKAFAFSYLLAGTCIKNNKPVNIYSSFKKYCTKGLFTFIAIPISIIIDLSMSALFIGFFRFEI